MTRRKSRIDVESNTFVIAIVSLRRSGTERPKPQMGATFSLLTIVFALCGSVMAQMPAADANKIFAYDATKPLNFTIERSETPVAGVTVSEISYDSPKGGRVPGYLVVPSGRGPFAATVYMHWGQGNRGEFLSEAVEMARRGAIGIMIDAPYWGPDVPQPAKGKEAESERDNYIQMVVDLRRAVDVLIARKDVDGARIGYVGHSLGATWGAPLAAAEKRIKVFVLMGGLPKVPPRLGRRQLLPASAARHYPEDRVRQGSCGAVTYRTGEVCGKHRPGKDLLPMGAARHVHQSEISR